MRTAWSIHGRNSSLFPVVCHSSLRRHQLIKGRRHRAMTGSFLILGSAPLSAFRAVRRKSGWTEMLSTLTWRPVFDPLSCLQRMPALVLPALACLRKVSRSYLAGTTAQACAGATDFMRTYLEARCSRSFGPRNSLPSVLERLWTMGAWPRSLLLNVLAVGARSRAPASRSSRAISILRGQTLLLVRRLPPFHQKRRQAGW